MNTCVGLVWFACPVLVTVVSFLWYTKVEGHELTARLVVAIQKQMSYVAVNMALLTNVSPLRGLITPPVPRLLVSSYLA